MDVAIEARHITARALDHLRQRSGLEIGDDRVGGDELPEIIAGDVIGGAAVRHDRVAAVASHVLGALAADRHQIFEQHAEIVLGERIAVARSEEHTSELQSLMRISYAVFCLKKKKNPTYRNHLT